MSTAPTLPRKGSVGELEERIDVLMIVEAQPEHLTLSCRASPRGPSRGPLLSTRCAHARGRAARSVPTTGA